jgi:hypothetical protein
MTDRSGEAVGVSSPPLWPVIGGEIVKVENAAI